MYRCIHLQYTRYKIKVVQKCKQVPISNTPADKFVLGLVNPQHQFTILFLAHTLKLIEFTKNDKHQMNPISHKSHNKK